MFFGKPVEPCGDCVDGKCTMNCSAPMRASALFKPCQECGHPAYCVTQERCSGKIRGLLSGFLLLCEDMEAEADKLEGASGECDHQVGFARGQRKAAKSMRNAIAECFRTANI